MTVITWWLGRGPRPEKFRELFVAPFNASGFDIRVDLVDKGAAAQTAVLAALEDGTGPDIFMIPRTGDFVSLVKSGRVLALDEAAHRFRWDSRILKPARDLGQVDGHLFGVPRSLETMLLYFDRALFAKHQWSPPTTAVELRTLADEMMAENIVPFGAGSVDFPGSCEWYLSLILNHAAGPAAVRKVLRGDLPWTSPTFVEALTLLKEWFDRGWFGDAYFTRTAPEGFADIATGVAAMAPTLTWAFDDARTVFAGREADIGVAPFPSLGPAVPTPTYLMGTASILCINSSSAHPKAAAAVLDALFAAEVRRRFAQRLPGDWNLPLTDSDTVALKEVATSQFAATTTALTDAVADGSFGYATWTFLSPTAEAASIDNFRGMIDGVVSPVDYLRAIEAASAIDAENGVSITIP
ncbi:hypothetical protein AX769_21070 (plasmid) [Frondihabitans sp. PAMC 28766]|uniref:ABC transporter substrate-binding protein n=1 Tax=Frondihabitans sp. PAMC 28766 TaxID=1795630 RepID=UPI00078C5C87|nr:extracellular solute-binding protein [Frondihabitans sp. PAMC 28766]AMM22633.1 hypothetical protein AX769_21070 [Frondihabitans sp. PAMC 28766]